MRDPLREFPYLPIKRVRRASILGHRHADVDAYCAAYGVARLLGRLSSSVRTSVSAPQGLSSLASHIHRTFQASFTSHPRLNDLDLIVIVDTGHASLLEDWIRPIKDATCPKVMIDHHPLSPSLRKLVDHFIIDEKASSTSELVFRVWRAKRLAPSSRVSNALLTGILSDSQHLNIASEETLRAVVALVGHGASLKKARTLLRVKRQRPEVIARLKAARRLRMYEMGKWLMVTSTVGSFHASVARSLLDLGADLALAAGETDVGSRGSFRSTQGFYQETGIHLGVDIAQELALILSQGTGGGHPTAASVECNDLLRHLLEKSLQTISRVTGYPLEEVA